MLNVGAPELGVLLVVGLLLAGPERMPSIVRDLGRGVRKFRAGVDGMTTQLRDEAGLDIDELRSLHPRRLLDELTQSDDVTSTNASGQATQTNHPNTGVPPEERSASGRHH
jgi:TatA/E family protein of Tat protein translocase